MSDCDFCGLPVAARVLSASMMVCEDCVELAVLLDEALEETEV